MAKEDKEKDRTSGQLPRITPPDDAVISTKAIETALGASATDKQKTDDYKRRIGAEPGNVKNVTKPDLTAPPGAYNIIAEAMSEKPLSPEYLRQPDSVTEHTTRLFESTPAPAAPSAVYDTSKINPQGARTFTEPPGALAAKKKPKNKPKKTPFSRRDFLAGGTACVVVAGATVLYGELFSSFGPGGGAVNINERMERQTHKRVKIKMAENEDRLFLFEAVNEGLFGNAEIEIECSRPTELVLHSPVFYHYNPDVSSEGDDLLLKFKDKGDHSKICTVRFKDQLKEGNQAGITNVIRLGTLGRYSNWEGLALPGMDRWDWYYRKSTDKVELEEMIPLAKSDIIQALRYLDAGPDGGSATLPTPIGSTPRPLQQRIIDTYLRNQRETSADKHTGRER